MSYRWMQTGIVAALLAAPAFSFAQDPDEELQKQLQEFQKQLQEQLRMQLQNVPRGGFGGGAFGLAPRPGRLGVRLEPPSEVLREQLNLPSDQGLVISEVIEGSVADKAGLRQWDVLLEFGDKVVTPDPTSFIKLVTDVKADGVIDIVVLRKGRKETIKAVKLPEAAKVADEPLRGARPFMPVNPFVPNIFNLPNGNPDAVRKNSTSTSITVNDGDYTIANTTDGVKTTLRGRMEEGHLKPSSIEVVDGDTTVKAESIDKLPEKYRAEIEKMVRKLR